MPPLRAALGSAALAAVLLIGPAAAAPVTPEATAIQTALDAKDIDRALDLARAALAAEEALPTPDPLRLANYARLLGDALFETGDAAGAEPHYRKALELRMATLDAADADIAVSANDLAIALRRQGNVAAAEPYYRQALAVRMTALGPTDPRTARTAYFLARDIDDQQRPAEAAAAMATAIALAEQSYGPTDETTIGWRGDRAAMLHDAGDPAAEAEYRAAIAAGEKGFADSNDTRLAAARHGLGRLLFADGRAGEAAPLLTAALATREAVLGPDDPATLRTAETLARALWASEERRMAETLFQRVATAREAQYGPDAPEVADMLRWVGRAQVSRGAHAAAELTYKRVLAIGDATQGQSPLLTGFDLIALGQLYSSERRFTEARPLLERAVALLSTDSDVLVGASARLALAMLSSESGRMADAVALARQVVSDMQAAAPESRDLASALVALAGFESTAGDASAAITHARSGLALYARVAPDTQGHVSAMGTLGRILLDTGEWAEAETLHRQALAALTAHYGTNAPETGTALSDLGAVLFARGDFAGAAGLFGQAVALVDAAAARDADTAFSARTGEIEDQSVARAGLYDRLIETYDRLARATPAQADAYALKSFTLAQRVAASRAAGALAAMAARQATGAADLADLVRQRQDLVAQWQEADRRLTALRADANSSAATRGVVAAEAARLDGQIVEIDRLLSARVPGLAELQQPRPLEMAEVAARLDKNDVLLFFADAAPRGGPHESYVWAVTPDGALHWRRLGQADTELRAGVRSLRDALGVAGSTRGPKAVARSTGRDRTGRVLAAAHALYGPVLGPLDDLLAGRNLVIVPSRSLSALPFHLLLPRLPDAAATDRFGAADWLVRRHAITVLPAVSSLTAVTAGAAPTASPTYLAFANPLLSGRTGSDRRAFARKGCDGAQPVRLASARSQASVRLTRGASGDVAAVRALPPLPETTDEVCAIADLLGAPESALHLGADASEAGLAALSQSGALAAARIVHFATHGLVSGDLDGLAEPALVLTPPETASADADGLLTASEVAGLKLAADWVILSACNTAGSDGSGEALSGLARAFFYAGARSLLVSHWPVNSAAAVALATTAVAQFAADPAAGKGEALRQAMLAEIARGGSHADPVNWAPFVVVGG